MVPFISVILVALFALLWINPILFGKLMGYLVIMVICLFILVELFIICKPLALVGAVLLALILARSRTTE